MFGFILTSCILYGLVCFMPVFLARNFERNRLLRNPRPFCRIRENITDLEPDYIKLVDEHYWDLV